MSTASERFAIAGGDAPRGAASGTTLSPWIPLATLGLRRRLSVSLSASVGVQGLGVLTGVLLARALGAEGRGTLAAILLWPAVLAALGCLGLPDSTTFHAARETLATGRLVATTLLIGVVQSIVLSAIGLAVVPLVLGRYGPHAVALGLGALSFVPVYLVTLYLMNILNGLQRTGSFQALRLLVVATTGAALAGLFVAGHLTLATAVAAQVGAHALAGVGAMALILRTVEGPFRPDRRAARLLVSFGIRSHLNAVAVDLNERLDQVLIALVLGPLGLGLYVIAVTMTSLTGIVGGAVSVVALPTVARLVRKDEQIAAARRCVGVVAGISLLITVPVIVLAPQLIELFFGSSFRPAVNVARILLVAAVVLSTARVVGAVVTAIGRPLDAGIPELAGLCVTIALLAVLLPTLGLTGAAVASLAAYTVTCVGTLRRAGRTLGTPALSLLLPAAGRAHDPGVQV